MKRMVNRIADIDGSRNFISRVKMIERSGSMINVPGVKIHSTLV